jgi:2-dehydropantoate 2-reductase
LPENERFDYVFVTSKLYDLKKNLKQLLKNHIKAEYLVSIQNGLVDESLYTPYIKNPNFTSISVFEGFRLVENQLTVALTKIGWKTDSSLCGKKVSKLLKSAGINCVTEKDLEAVKAEKTIMNCSVNLLSAIEKKTIFELCANTKTRRVIDKLFDESYEVLSNSFDLGGREKLRRKFYKTVGQMKHYSSTYQDALSGRKTEASFLNGYIIKLAAKYHVKTPTNRKVVNKFKRMYK